MESCRLSDAYIPPPPDAVALGFAIPARTVIDIVEDLLDDGTAVHPFIGVTPGRLSPQIAEPLGLSTDRGVLVLDVVENSPAVEAGLERGDITEFAGDAVPTIEDFLAVLRDVNPGDQVQMQVTSNGETQTLSITVGELET